MRTYNMLEAISAINPDLRFAVDDSIENEEERFNNIIWYNGVDENDSVIEGEPDNKPTWEEVEAEFAKVKEEGVANQYYKERMFEYPKLEDQFDMLWHAIDSGTLDKTSDFYMSLKAVKDAHPKPTE